MVMANDVAVSRVRAVQNGVRIHSGPLQVSFSGLNEGQIRKGDSQMPGIDSAEQLSREQLYEEVWATPMRHVGTKYGLSGTEVRRLCDELEVPVPAQGHWTRVQMGHAVERPQLPVVAQEQKSKVVPRKRSPRLSTRKVPGLREPASAAPPQPAAANEILPTPARWHKALHNIRERIKKDVANAELLKRKDEWEQSHPGKRHPAYLDSYGSWEYFCDAGQLLATTHRKSVARLSLRSYMRGIALLNAICYQAETIGYSVSMEKDDSRLRLTRDQAHVDLRMGEKLDAGFRQRIRSWDKTTERVKRLSPSGRLFIFVEQQGTGETEVADRPDMLLERQLDRIFDVIALRYQGSVSRVAEWAQWELDSKAAEIRRQEEERQRKDAQERAEMERQRRIKFISEAESWDKARVLRAYLAELDQRFADGGIAMDGYVEWREWARIVANELDRSAMRVKSVTTDSNPVIP